MGLGHCRVRQLAWAGDASLCPRPDAQRARAGRLRDIEAVADAALSRLDERSLLKPLVERVKQVLQADTEEFAGRIGEIAFASNVTKSILAGVDIRRLRGYSFSRSPERQ